MTFNTAFQYEWAEVVTHHTPVTCTDYQQAPFLMAVIPLDDVTTQNEATPSNSWAARACKNSGEFLLSINSKLIIHLCF